MNFKFRLTILILLAFISMISCSENSSSDNDQTPDEPELTQHYYFEGNLDNVPFLIEKKEYKDYFDGKPFSLDYGGTLINCSNEPNEGIHTDCYTIYSCGIIIYDNLYPDEAEKHNTGKMYFGSIDVDKRVFDNELEALEDFLEKEKLSFRRDFGSIKHEGSFAFDFFPPNQNKNEQYYYSSRFNNNEEYTAEITSVEKADDYFYIIEGSVEACKLYDSRETKDDNQAYKLLTDFKFRVKIKADFNYNNYK